MGRVIGIDLGTTNSLVAAVDGRSSRILLNRFGERLTPSAVRFLPDGKPIVGQAAFDARLRDPAHTITGIKRFMGRTYNEVADLAEAVPYEVVPGIDNRAAVMVHDRIYTPEEISALILGDLRVTAEAALGEPVDEAVVTVPAYFTHAQRNATATAARRAGLELKRLVAEPTAAAMAYQRDRLGDRERTVMVVDLGGGTYDVTLAELGDKVADVIAISGDNHLGGDDFDRVLADWVRDEIRHTHGVSVAEVPGGDERLVGAITRARCELSLQDQTVVRLPFLFQRDGVLVDVEVPISRALFEDVAAELFERLLPPIDQVLHAVNYELGSFETLLVGGATRMPRVAELVQRRLGHPARRGVNPDESVALGAGYQAGVLSGEIKDFLLLDTSYQTIAVETVGGAVCCVIPRNTTIPTRKRHTFTVLDPGQTAVEVHLVQGDRPLAVDNRTLGRVVLELRSRPAPVREIVVTVDIDANSTVSITVADTAEGGGVAHTTLSYG